MAGAAHTDMKKSLSSRSAIRASVCATADRRGRRHAASCNPRDRADSRVPADAAARRARRATDPRRPLRRHRSPAPRRRDVTAETRADARFRRKAADLGAVGIPERHRTRRKRCGVTNFVGWVERSETQRLGVLRRDSAVLHPSHGEAIAQSYASEKYKTGTGARRPILICAGPNSRPGAASRSSSTIARRKNGCCGRS